MSADKQAAPQKRAWLVEALAATGACLERTAVLAVTEDDARELVLAHWREHLAIAPQDLEGVAIVVKADDPEPPF